MAKIKNIQFDPNGFCNAKCWYCPVRYEQLPPYKNMSIEDVDIIFSKINDLKGIYFDNDLLVYTAHYNEFLLYPYIKDFLDILRKYNIKTLILSNGTNISPEKMNILNEYNDIVCGINLNIPTIDKEQWINQVGLNENQYEKLINNLDYIHDKYHDKISIGMNGISDKSILTNNGHLLKMNNFPDFIKEDTLDDEYNKFKNKYPNFNIYKNTSLVDRNNILEKNNIYSTTLGNIMNNKKDGNFVIGCSNGNRFDEWVHINSNGDVFLCCNDYNYDYIFGNIIEQKFEDIWESDLRKNTIESAKKHICTNCLSAIWSSDFEINNNIRILINILYDKFRKYFESGDMIITGSIVYNKIGLYKKNEIKDLDISIIDGDYGDTIINEVKDFFSNNKFDFNVEYTERKWNKLRGICVTDYGVIDIFRNDHNNKEEESTIEILPNIYTKYYGHNWIVDVLCKSYDYHSKQNTENSKRQKDKFYNMLSSIYNNYYYDLDIKLRLRLKWMLNIEELTIDETNILFSIGNDIDYLVKLLYNNFKKYFDNGDIIFTGSYVYNKMGILNKKEIKDLDISIINGYNGNLIANEIAFFIEQQYDIMGKFIRNEWFNKIGFFYTNKGIIDIFRNDHNYKNNEKIFEILPNINTKFYGIEWILDIMYNNIKYLENEIKSNKFDEITINNKKNDILKFKNNIIEIISNTNHNIENIDILNYLQLK